VRAGGLFRRRRQLGEGLAATTIPVMPIRINLRGEAIEAAVKIGALAHIEAVAAIARFKVGDLAEFCAQTHRLAARERPITHARIDTRINLALALVDRRPTAVLAVIAFPAHALREVVEPAIKVGALARG